ncbi:TetR/AcrR family transcriptional regulator [Roseateles sp. DAIF2]|uniref:TetR/AcrR family transcriptional regulator n=1 Tax=Roseateles sp. DAIF2 TaxID=2714952 RepID=UPI0018A295F6|nr:TetR/AcrR family transcriptional regulator [Roseateles sp. DAIF2]QPF75477.1 TetR/AcrR family transcriptional regulator [Roseateles sp. DAIF2]
MDPKPSRKEQTRERILETAARAIRRGGYQGVGVADIMKEAGLTHGGFYAHFESRDAMLAAALERAGHDGAERIGRAMAQRQAQGADPLRALVESYLHESTLASQENGCPVAALASEMPRQSELVREASARRVAGLIARVRQVLPTAAPAGRAEAIASQLVGALQLARALGDNEAGRALLAANREALLAQRES